MSDGLRGYTEDTPHTNEHAGAMILGIFRPFGPEATVDADGDYCPISLDGDGAVYVKVTGTITTSSASGDQSRPLVFFYAEPTVLFPKAGDDEFQMRAGMYGALYTQIRRETDGLELGITANPFQVQIGDGSRQASVRDTGSNDSLNVAITDASGNHITTFAGTEYTEGNTDSSITGTAILWEDTSDTLRAVSAAKPLPVGDAGGSLTVDGTVTADTELPAAAALADSTVNPTVPSVGALPLVWNAASARWNRALSGKDVADDITYANSVGLLGVTPAFEFNSSGDVHYARLAYQDTNVPARVLLVNHGGYDEANDRVHRWRGNWNVTLLSSAARTGTTTSSDQTNRNCRGVYIYVNVTAVTATPAVTLSLQRKDPLSGTYDAVFTAGAAIGATGQFTYHIAPSAAAGAMDGALAAQLPYTWRISMAHGDADSITYSVTADVLV